MGLTVSRRRRTAVPPAAYQPLDTAARYAPRSIRARGSASWCASQMVSDIEKVSVSAVIGHDNRLDFRTNSPLPLTSRKRPQLQLKNILCLADGHYTRSRPDQVTGSCARELRSFGGEQSTADKAAHVSGFLSRFVLHLSQKVQEAQTPCKPLL